MTDKVGKYFLGKAINGRDYVWGKILSRDGQDSEKFVAGFFPWSPDTSETDAIRQTVITGQMTGWAYFSTASELNQAVADLARSLATVAQYDRPKPAGKKKMKKAAGKSQGEARA
jgi:hypothetical protein